jgi:Tfp pilus assembly protein PilV
MHNNFKFKKTILGASLMELVISIVVIAIGTTGIFSLYIQTTKASIEPILLNQAGTIAQSYMEEILQQTFAVNANPAGRNNFNDVSDYNGLSDTNGPRDRFNTAVSNMQLYNVRVTVSNSAINGIASKRISVEVTHDSWQLPAGNFSQNITLIAHKTAG